jgi:copper chaperone CopZ
VEQVSVELARKTMTVTGAASASEIKQALNELGFDIVTEAES